MAPVLSVKAMKNHSAFAAILDKILANLMAPASNFCKIFFLTMLSCRNAHDLLQIADKNAAKIDR